MAGVERERAGYFHPLPCFGVKGALFTMTGPVVTYMIRVSRCLCAQPRAGWLSWLCRSGFPVGVGIGYRASKTSVMGS